MDVSRSCLLTMPWSILSLLLLLSAGTFAQNGDQSTDWIWSDQAAIALEGFSLYTDSSFRHQTRVHVPEAGLLRVLERSEGYSSDGSEKQRFRWFRVEAANGKTGWVLGDKIARIQEGWKLQPGIKRYQRSRVDLGPPFEFAICWLAALEGLDDLYGNDFLNPRYREEYLVITARSGQSLLLPLGREGKEGAAFTHDLTLRDFTGDQHAEIVLYQGNYAIGSSLDERHFEVHQLLNGKLEKILEEPLSLRMPDGRRAPTLYKVVEYGPGLIRLGYIDFLSCRDYSLPYPTDFLHFTDEWCMEYVTYTYVWNEEHRQLEKWYGENHSAPKAMTSIDGILLKKMPSEETRTVGTLPRGVPLVVIKQISSPMEGVPSWLLVRTPEGAFGYLKAGQVRFTDSEHAAILNEHYRDRSVKPGEVEWVRWVAD